MAEQARRAVSPELANLVREIKRAFPAGCWVGGTNLDYRLPKDSLHSWRDHSPSPARDPEDYSAEKKEQAPQFTIHSSVQELSGPICSASASECIGPGPVRLNSAISTRPQDWAEPAREILMRRGAWPGLVAQPAPDTSWIKMTEVREGWRQR